MSKVGRWVLPEDPGLEELLREQVAITIEGMAGVTAWTEGDSVGGQVVRGGCRVAAQRPRGRSRAGSAWAVNVEA